MQNSFNLNELPKLADSITYLYVEKCRIEQDNFAVKLEYGQYSVPVPCANLTVLFVGPGVTITQAAIVSLSDCGCLIIWCGENLRKFYACGFPETRSAKNILKQAKACMNEKDHLEVVRKMYKLRFPELVLDDMTLAQMRGLEGVRMRTCYSVMSKQFNIPWNGRNLRGIDYNKMDDINKAITYNNSLLYSLCLGVISTLGFNSSLGFIHVGNINSFVYDISDLYKVDITIPAAFESVKEFKGTKSGRDLESICRMNTRKYFSKCNIMKKMVEDINYLFSDIVVTYGDSVDGALWNYGRDVLSNKNYGDIL